MPLAHCAAASKQEINYQAMVTWQQDLVMSNLSLHGRSNKEGDGREAVEQQYR